MWGCFDLGRVAKQVLSASSAGPAPYFHAHWCVEGRSSYSHIGGEGNFCWIFNYKQKTNTKGSTGSGSVHGTELMRMKIISSKFRIQLTTSSLLWKIRNAMSQESPSACCSRGGLKVVRLVCSFNYSSKTVKVKSIKNLTYFFFSSPMKCAYLGKELELLDLGYYLGCTRLLDLLKFHACTSLLYANIRMRYMYVSLSDLNCKYLKKYSSRGDLDREVQPLHSLR